MARTDPPSRWRGRGLPLGLSVLLAGIALAVAVQLRAGRDYEVARSSESIRATPDGRKIGTLLEGARVEELSRDGRWVKFRVEGWIWGPSLEGFAGATDEPESEEGEAAVRGSRQEGERKPRPAISVHLDDVRDLIDDHFGQFYGMRLDPDLGELQIRFRVPRLEPEALERRQMRVQLEVLGALAGEVEFSRMRVETNRADGSGEVGAEIAVTPVEDIRRIAGKDLEMWRQRTRRSTDGGKTWAGPR